MVAALPPALIGILAAATDWAARGLADPEPALVLPYVLRHLTPPAVSVIGLAAVAAAVMSSVDSSILSASSMAAWNVYRPLVDPGASSATLTRVVKRTVLVAGVAATIMALHVRSVYALWVLCSDLVYCVLFPQLVLALYDPRANRWGSYGGMAVAFGLRLAIGEPLLGLPRLLPVPADAAGLALLPVKTLIMVTALATMWTASRATARRCEPEPLAAAQPTDLGNVRL
jgi:high affinity choline transporter 7